MTTKTNQPQHAKNRDFGLPQEEFKPIESEGGKWLKITTLIVVFALALGAGFVYWFFYHTPSAGSSTEAYLVHEEYERETSEADADFINEDIPVLDQYAKRDTEKINLSKAPEVSSGEKQTKNFHPSHNTKPAKGTITKINAPQGYYYVVVGSFIDDDLASDYAEKLAQKGVDVMLIAPPQGQYFFRIAIEQKDAFYDAQAILASLKEAYGMDIWVTKY